jgi:hypothetical protein
LKEIAQPPIINALQQDRRHPVHPPIGLTRAPQVPEYMKRLRYAASSTDEQRLNMTAKCQSTSNARRRWCWKISLPTPAMARRRLIE